MFICMLGLPALQQQQPPITNAPVMIDMVQNNPGDPVGWEQTKYFDPAELKKLNFTAMTTTGEMSGTQVKRPHLERYGGGGGGGGGGRTGVGPRRKSCCPARAPRTVGRRLHFIK